jgi:hypothetical protein
VKEGRVQGAIALLIYHRFSTRGGEESRSSDELLAFCTQLSASLQQLEEHFISSGIAGCEQQKIGIEMAG